MKSADALEPSFDPATSPDAADLLDPLLHGSSARSLGAVVTVGKVVALSEEGVPLVLYPGQPQTAAMLARSVVDVNAAHIGKQAVLLFENADREKPIIVGLLRNVPGWPADKKPANVEVAADGEGLMVSASERLVLRCGKASITLTRAGKVIIEGAYVSAHSSGVVRLKGGAVQLN